MIFLCVTGPAMCYHDAGRDGQGVGIASVTGEKAGPAQMIDTTPREEIRLIGLPVSDGVALARVRLMDKAGVDAIPFLLIDEEAVPSEIERLEKALVQTAAQLDALIEKITERIGPAQASIFLAQKLMVGDPSLREEMSGTIRNLRFNAEAAIEKTFESYRRLFAELEDDYLKDRAADVDEIRRRLLDTIIREKSGASPEPPKTASTPLADFEVIVAEELMPGQTISLDTGHTAGFITERGGTASHAAILARALGIPAVSGIHSLSGFFLGGEEVLLNGATGEVIIWPSESTLRLYPAVRHIATQRIRAVPPVKGLVVMANLNVSEELETVLSMQAEGIGLYRTEVEFLAEGRLLTEEEQYERYAGVVRGMGGAPVQFRMMDFGGDKPAPFEPMEAEDNPALGYRGARWLLGNPNLFSTQARALARASRFGPVRILYPMIADLDQFLKLRELFRRAVADIDHGHLRHGVMLEIPSACLAIRDIFAVADFASIGSNDLIQYLFAVDRNNERVAADYHPNRAVFWELLARIVGAAREYNRPLSLCGELGSDPKFLPKLIECGITSVSINPRLIGLARAAARRYLK